MSPANPWAAVQGVGVSRALDRARVSHEPAASLILELTLTRPYVVFQGDTGGTGARKALSGGLSRCRREPRIPCGFDRRRHAEMTTLNADPTRKAGEQAGTTPPRNARTPLGW